MAENIVQCELQSNETLTHSLFISISILSFSLCTQFVGSCLSSTSWLKTSLSMEIRQLCTGHSQDSMEFIGKWGEQTYGQNFYSRI